MQSHRMLLIAVTVVISCVFVAGQAAPSSTNVSNPSSVFRAQSRLVVVDVIVTDKKGNTVEGLKPSDFSVFEEGARQEIRFFEEHTSPKGPADLPKLPEGQFTNYPVMPAQTALDILLFDFVNTDPTDQAYAQKQMLKALQKLEPGQQMALFILSGRGLSMIQGPTGSTMTVREAAKLVEAQPAPTMQNMWDFNNMLATIAIQAKPLAGGISSTEMSASVAERLRWALFKETAYLTDRRVDLTLGALEGLAHTVSGYAGRKNLIWISSGIPFRIGPGQGIHNFLAFREQRDYLPKVVKTGTLLADAQVSVYPVDLRGLDVRGADFKVQGLGADAGSQAYSSLLQNKGDDAWNNRVAMEDLALQTGGRAFTGSNDLSKSITSAVHHGARYYTVAYSPSNLKFDANYRKIKVQAARKDLQLSYREGYVAAPDRPASAEDATRALLQATQLGMPSLSSLLMRVQVQPPDKQNPKVKIDYAVAANDVNFSQEPDNSRRAILDFLTVAWDEHGRVAQHSADFLATTLKAGAVNATLKTGLPMHHELDLKPGKYFLCLSTMDRSTQKIGTVWVPLIVPDASKN